MILGEESTSLKENVDTEEVTDHDFLEVRKCFMGEIASSKTQKPYINEDERIRREDTTPGLIPATVKDFVTGQASGAYAVSRTASGFAATVIVPASG